MTDRLWTGSYEEARWSHIIELAKEPAAERMRLLEEAIRFALRSGARTREDILGTDMIRDGAGDRDA